MKKLFALSWTLALLAIVVFSACVTKELTDPTENLDDDEIYSLDLEYGGYGTNDEAAAFGDPDLLSDFGGDADVSDTFAADAAIVDVLNSDSSDVKVYIVRVTWGYLHGDSTATEVTDWSGSAEVSKGTLLVLRKIRFEDNDFVHLPRTSRQLVEFTSQTKPHFDGLLFAVIDNDTTDSADCTFTINAGAYSKTLDFSEMDSLDIIEAVGDAGQEVSLSSHSRQYTPFAGGFIEGHWNKTKPNGGFFRGRWINSLGSNAGFLEGIWGINRFGNKVFRGKYINMNGEFRGLLAGQWSYGRENDNVGFFAGHWANRALQVVGTLAGHFKTGEAGDGRGFFQGRYSVSDRGRLEGDPNRDDGQ